MRLHLHDPRSPLLQLTALFVLCSSTCTAAVVLKTNTELHRRYQAYSCSSKNIRHSKSNVSRVAHDRDQDTAATEESKGSETCATRDPYALLCTGRVGRLPSSIFCRPQQRRYVLRYARLAFPLRWNETTRISRQSVKHRTSQISDATKSKRSPVYCYKQ